MLSMFMNDIRQSISLQVGNDNVTTTDHDTLVLQLLKKYEWLMSV